MDEDITAVQFIKYLKELEKYCCLTYTINTGNLVKEILNRSILKNNLEEVKYIITNYRIYYSRNTINEFIVSAYKYNHKDIAEYILNNT